MNTMLYRDNDDTAAGSQKIDGNQNITVVLAYGPSEGDQSLTLCDIRPSQSRSMEALVRALEHLPVNALGHRLFLTDVALPPACGVGAWPCRLNSMPSENAVCNMLIGLGQALGGEHPIAQIHLSERYTLDETEWHALSLGQAGALSRVAAVDRFERAFQPLMTDETLDLRPFVRITKDEAKEAGDLSDWQCFSTIFETESHFAIAPADYDRFSKQVMQIKSLCPEATVSLRNHAAKWGSKQVISRMAIHVSLQFEGEDLVRAFAFA